MSFLTHSKSYFKDSRSSEELLISRGGVYSWD